LILRATSLGSGEGLVKDVDELTYQARVFFAIYLFAVVAILVYVGVRPYFE